MKITALKAVQMNKHGQSIVKVETDEGLFGLGEAGGPGPVVRANLKDYFEPILLGQDPLNIEKLYTIMTRDRSQWQARYVHFPTVSGIDVALWDIAGKFFKRPVADLLAGRFRDSIELYGASGGPSDWMDPSSCRDWAQKEKAHPCGFRTIKIGFEPLLGDGGRTGPYGHGRPSRLPPQTALRRIEKGFLNVREALGWDTDIIVHCHNEWDLPSALGITEAIAPSRPLWIEDPLPVMYSDSWRALRNASPVRIMTGEKLELASDFLPFIVNGGVHILHPDLAYAGGITGLRKVAFLSEQYSIPLALHSVGTIVQLIAGAHFGAMVQNFVISENRIAYGDAYEAMDRNHVPPRDGLFKVPTGPGLGIDFDPLVVKENLLPGEPWWD